MASLINKVKIDSMQFGFKPGKELLLMQFLPYSRYRRNIGVKETSSTLLL